MKFLCPLLLLLAAPAAAQRAAPAPTPAEEVRLANVASYFVPPSAQQFMIDGVEAGIRQRLVQDPQLIALERDYPGIGEALAGGAGAEIRRLAPAVVGELHARVRSHLAGRLSADELRMFSDYVSLPSVSALISEQIELRDGETASDAVDRHFARQEGRPVPAAERAAMTRFENSREGRHILEVVQAHLPAVRDQAHSAAEAAAGRALQAALRAGNAFASARYPQRPRPFAID
jgi:hypothetical protein